MNITLNKSKVAIISDLHLGIHSNSSFWHEIAINWAKWLKEELNNKKITDIDPEEELYMAYGYEYWMSSKWPLQLFETARNNYENTSNTREWTSIRRQYN